MRSEITSQKKMINSVRNIPVEYFKWGTSPDHFKIDLPHRHEFAELVFFTKGGGIHEIDYTNHEIKKGAIHYVPKSIVHYLKRDSSSDGFTLSFDTVYFEANNIHNFLNPLKDDPFVIDLSDATFQVIYEQAKILIRQIKQKNKYYQEKCFLLSLDLLFHSIASEKEDNHLSESPIKFIPLVRKFKYLVSTNIHHSHSVSWYAQELNVSPKYLSNSIKKNLGISAKRYILENLLTSIKKNLFGTHKTIKLIAFEHQYNESALGKLFRKNVGCTMKAYRSENNMK